MKVIITVPSSELYPVLLPIKVNLNTLKGLIYPG